MHIGLFSLLSHKDYSSSTHHPYFIVVFSLFSVQFEYFFFSLENNTLLSLSDDGCLSSITLKQKQESNIVTKNSISQSTHD